MHYKYTGNYKHQHDIINSFVVQDTYSETNNFLNYLLLTFPDRNP